MPGIFPAPTGVPAADADNAYIPANAPVGCTPSWYGRDCQTLNYADAMNAIVSEILAAIDRLGIAYDCGRIDNLGAALASVIGDINTRITATNGNLTTLTGRVTIVESDLGAVQTALTALQGTVTGQGSAITALQTALASLNAGQVVLSPALGPYTTVQAALDYFWTQLAPAPTNTIRGRNDAGSGPVENLSPIEVAAMLPLATVGAQGALPSLSGNPADMLRGDGTFGPQAGVTPLMVGALIPYAGGTAPSGTLLCYGQAISRGTYSLLFAAIGTAWGVGDGSSTFNVPDFRGRTFAGRDNMGGTASNRLTNTGTGNSGIDGNTVGATGGTDRYAISATELPSHTHTFSRGGVGQQGTGGSGAGGALVADTTGAVGGNAAHTNVQPTGIVNVLIVTGVP